MNIRVRAIHLGVDMDEGGREGGREGEGGEGGDSLKVRRVCKREIGLPTLLWEAAKKTRKTGEIEKE